jgi:hypothetical protein
VASVELGEEEEAVWRLGSLGAEESVGVLHGMAACGCVRR